MRFQQTYLKGSYLISLDLLEHERGFFARTFCKEAFSETGINTSWEQINNSLSHSKGTLRGLHMQKEPHSEIKLVRCISGTVWDVIVDLRKNSETYGQYFAEELSAVNRKMMYVPKGFAHGFVSLKDSSEIIYLVSTPYHPESEETILWNDPDIGIKWPTKISLISEKDTRGKKLKDLNK